MHHDTSRTMPHRPQPYPLARRCRRIEYRVADSGNRMHERLDLGGWLQRERK